MENQDISLILSLITGVISLVLAGFAIWLGKSAERESRANFDRTQSMMADYYDKTKDVLAEIDKRAAVIEKTVAESHQQLLNTVTNLLSQIATPAKPDIGEQLGMEFMQQMMRDPAQAKQMMEALQPLIDISEKQQG